jgi:hypothetical protein
MAHSHYINLDGYSSTSSFLLTNISFGTVQSLMSILHAPQRVCLSNRILNCCNKMKLYD